jgi:hypothetical protein
MLATSLHSLINLEVNETKWSFFFGSSFTTCCCCCSCQPQVKEATVDLATESAVVQVATEPVAASGWEAVKRQLGESLAKHLTSCGFKSSLKGIC